jgi:hypothetical protein
MQLVFPLLLHCQKDNHEGMYATISLKDACQTLVASCLIAQAEPKTITTGLINGKVIILKQNGRQVHSFISRYKRFATFSLTDLFYATVSMRPVLNLCANAKHTGFRMGQKECISNGKVLR